MAIYSCNISNVSRAKGSSSCATLAYISGEEVKNELTGQLHKYGQQDRIIDTGTIIPQNAPLAFQDPKKLFNSIEKFETASNARTAKKIMVALPKEFDLVKQKEVVESYIRENITTKGYACTYAIHHDKNNNNPHAHILIANRQINDKGEWSIKSRKEYALDENNERIPQLDAKGNQKLGKRNEKLWKRISVQVNPLDKKETLQEFREQWAKECNKHLTPEQQIDHRSYAEQGKEEEPTIHEGYTARKIETQGDISERCEINRAIAARNNLLKQIQAETKIITKEIHDLTQYDLTQETHDLTQRNLTQETLPYVSKNYIGAKNDVETISDALNDSVIENDLEQKERAVWGQFEGATPSLKLKQQERTTQAISQPAIQTPAPAPALKIKHSPRILDTVSKERTKERTLDIVSKERNDIKEKLDNTQNALNYAEYLETCMQNLNVTIRDCDEIIESKGYKYYNERAFGLKGKLPFGEGKKWRNEQVNRAIERKNKAMSERKELFKKFKEIFGLPYRERSVVYDKLNDMIKAYKVSYKKLDNEWQPLAAAQRLVERKQREQTEKEHRQARQLDMECNPEKYRSKGLRR